MRHLLGTNKPEAESKNGWPGGSLSLAGHIDCQSSLRSPTARSLVVECGWLQEPMSQNSTLKTPGQVSKRRLIYCLFTAGISLSGVSDAHLTHTPR